MRLVSFCLTAPSWVVDMHDMMAVAAFTGVAKDGSCLPWQYERANTAGVEISLLGERFWS
jgi:hypothetical protein